MGSEQRTYPRVGLALAVSYRSTGSFLVAYSVNLSRGGLFIETSEPNPVGTTLSLTIDVPGVEDELKLSGVVAWTRTEPDGDQPVGMGVELKATDDAYGAIVDRLVRRFVGLKLVVGARSDRQVQKLRRQVRSVLSADVKEWQTSEPLPGDLGDVELLVVELDGHPGGTALLEEFLDAHPNAGVLALCESDDLRRRAKARGADECIASPPKTEDLRSALLRALSRPKIASK